MKRFLKNLIPFAIWIFLLMAAFPIFVDPYNIFHPQSIRDNGVEPNKNFIKMEYILKHPERFDALIFGSSRVGALHPEQIKGYRCYNMTYSEAVPKEQLNNLKTLLKNGITPKLILLGVDNISFLVDPELHKTDRMRMPHPPAIMERLRFYLNYLEPITTAQSLPVILNSKSAPDYQKIFYSGGWILPYNLPHKTGWWDDAEADWEDYYESRIPEALEEIREFKALCDENKIQLIVFTNPLHILTYEKSMENGYGTFLKGLAEITSFYHFSGINDITTNYYNYEETSHYRPEVGDLMLQIMLEGYEDEILNKQGFGQNITLTK